MIALCEHARGMVGFEHPVSAALDYPDRSSNEGVSVDQKCGGAMSIAQSFYLASEPLVSKP